MIGKSLYALVAMGGMLIVDLKCFGELAIPAAPMLLAGMSVAFCFLVFGIIQSKERL